MKTSMIFFVGLLNAAALIFAQNPAAVDQQQQAAAIQLEKLGAFKPGGPISFDIVLNEPLPDGAHFDFRISPASADEEVSLGTGKPVGDSRKSFRVSGMLPENALAGEWHIAVRLAVSAWDWMDA